ncbi:pentatricopeptide repeat-containing protein At2g36240-like [Lycium barbarum]|uniref:pentatricopeptide repeat-containing protein At2g36240-like n=1 Tax=Lycium barbarum TaxID=112863 RepID=UPI00293F6F0E|nr:pentatricopeptide repeat-containing protein At2g36240-like [Lycium barbarum]
MGFQKFLKSIPKSTGSDRTSLLPLAVRTIDSSLCTTNNVTPVAQNQLSQLMETHLKPSFTAKDFLSFLKNRIHYHPILTNLDFYLFNYAASVDSFRHDHTTYEWMARTLATTHRLQYLTTLLQFISSNPCPCADGIFSCPKTEPIYRFAINAYCKAGRFDDALLAFDTMRRLIDGKPDVAVCNIIIHGFVKFKHFDKALEFYRRMIGDRVKPDVITFNTLISGYCKNSQLGLALQMFKEMKTHGCAPNVVSFNTLIKWFLLDGKIEEGIGMAYEMTEMGWEISSVTCEILVDGLCRKRMVLKACDLLVDFSRKKVLPRTFDYFELVERLCSEGNVARAIELVSELWRNGDSPSLIACTTLIEGLRRTRKIDEASEIMEKMLQEGMVPDSVTFNCLVTDMCDTGRAKEANKMRLLGLNKGLDPDTVTYNILISGFKREGKKKESEALVEEMLDLGFIPDIATYNRLIDGQAKSKS